MDMKLKNSIRCATALSLAVVLSTSYAAGDSTTGATTPKSQTSMTGKQKATAIGAGTGAVAGAVVGGPVGAIVGAGVGGYVGHEGTDANGKTPATRASEGGTATSTDNTVRNAQSALNSQGYSPGAADGQMGPNTQSAIRRFQAEHGLTQTGTLDDATLSALGVSR